METGSAGRDMTTSALDDMGEPTLCLFFFQAEDGIRDYKVTGVQTCALPISAGADVLAGARPARGTVEPRRRGVDRGPARQPAALPGVLRAPAVRLTVRDATIKIGRASCRERV